MNLFYLSTQSLKVFNVVPFSVMEPKQIICIQRQIRKVIIYSLPSKYNAKKSVNWNSRKCIGCCGLNVPFGIFAILRLFLVKSFNPGSNHF